MLFSVIIPSYNRRALLPSTLESIRTQTLADYEVIVVDDGSTDGTLEYLHSLGSRVRLLRQVNRGPGAARNAGTAIAQGKYLAFLDSDDLWFPWTLETYAFVIREQSAPAFITGKPFRFHDEAKLTTVANPPLSINTFSDYLASGSEFRWWGVSSFVIRADAMRACGGFVEANQNAEDCDLAMKLGVAKGFVQITNPATFGYREHAGNVTADIKKTLEGVWRQLRTEAASGYPGGSQRQRERWQILTRHVRPLAIECLRQSLRPAAWQFYRTTFRWHCALGRWKFLFGFPIQACLIRW